MTAGSTFVVVAATASRWIVICRSERFERHSSSLAIWGVWHTWIVLIGLNYPGSTDCARRDHSSQPVADRRCGGTAEAKRRNLRVTGTLGVLRAAVERGLVNVPELVARLKATTFYADQALLKSAFGRWLE